jgi:hypothetical protein
MVREDFDVDLSKLLTKSETVHFSQRWQLLNHKVSEASLRGLQTQAASCTLIRRLPRQLDRFATEMYLQNYRAVCSPPKRHPLSTPWP